MPTAAPPTWDKGVIVSKDKRKRATSKQKRKGGAETAPEPVQRAKAGASKPKKKAEARTHQGYPIAAVPSPWWTVIGLVDDSWVEIYEAASEDECKRYRNSAIDDESPAFEKYEDISMLPPAHEHTIPAHVKGQLRTWLESTSESTKAARRAAAAPVGERSAARRKKAS